MMMMTTTTTVERTEVRDVTNADDLPDDVDVLKRTVLQLLESVKHLDTLNGRLQEQLEYLLRRRYGAQSERLDPAQLALFAKEIAAALGESNGTTPPEAIKEKKTAATTDSNGRTKRRSSGRRPLPEHLPREDVVYELDESARACPACGEERAAIGSKVSEQLEYVPAKLKVQRHVCTTYACRSCQGEVVTTPKPTGPIPKGLAGPGLLAHIVVSKFDDHRVPRRHAQLPEGRKERAMLH